MDIVIRCRELIKSADYRLTFHAETERDADCIRILEKKEDEEMKTCPFCKGGIEIHKIDHMHKWGSEFYLFKNTEAEVCKQCGEVFFRPDMLKLFDRHVAEKKPGKKTIHVPVIEMSDTATV